MSNQDLLIQLATELGLEAVLQENTARPCWIKDKVNGIKFELECQRNGTWRLIVAHDDVKNREILREAFPTCENRTQGVFITCADFDELAYTAYTVKEFIEVNELGRYTRPASAVGQTFAGTNFEGYGERDFMASVVQIQKLGFATLIPSVGIKLGFEYVAPSTNSRIDAVEFNENDEVITVIECQSGIQNGAYLDDEHFAKAISRYPQSAEVANTVKKIVVIAGGYTPEQLATFKQLPYEIVALQTVASNGQIVLETVAY
jgi:hypothetical protein